jgi:hypothetical protein
MPFEPSRLKWKNGALVIEGAMGAWPAVVRIYPQDFPVLLRLVWLPLLIVVLFIVAIIVGVAVL